MFAKLAAPNFRLPSFRSGASETHGRTLSKPSTASLVRAMIGMYFLAAVMGVLHDPVLTGLMATFSGAKAAQLLLLSLISLAALMVASGRHKRPAALFLAILTLCATALHFAQTWPPEALHGVWLQLLLVGALVTLASSEPVTTQTKFQAGLPARRPSKGTQVAPRRIPVRKPEADSTARPQAQIEARPVRQIAAAPAPAKPAAAARTAPMRQAETAPQSAAAAPLASARPDIAPAKAAALPVAKPVAAVHALPASFDDDLFGGDDDLDNIFADCSDVLSGATPRQIAAV